MRNASAGCAWSVNDSAGLTIRSGRPSSQPSGHAGMGGRCCAWPRGVPVRTHAADECNLLFGQGMLTHEMADARLDLPRRHESAARDLRDLCCSPPDILVSGEAERRGPAATMAGHTRREDDGRDVARERHALSVRRTPQRRVSSKAATPATVLGRMGQYKVPRELKPASLLITALAHGSGRARRGVSRRSLERIVSSPVQIALAALVAPAMDAPKTARRPCVGYGRFDDGMLVIASLERSRRETPLRVTPAHGARDSQPEGAVTRREVALRKSGELTWRFMSWAQRFLLKATFRRVAGPAADRSAGSWRRG